MPIAGTKKVAGGMLVEGTPIQDYRNEYGLWVKREDLSCPPPGPPFSKTRGVFAHIAKRPEKIIGALDTYHSQAGHAVARACQILGKKCLDFYPEFKNEPGYREPQERAQDLGAKLIGLPAGRSAILFHRAKKLCLSAGGYMMPNALKLSESVEETAKEVARARETLLAQMDYVLVPASSGTIAAGVIRGFHSLGLAPTFIIHLGYTRSHEEVEKYLRESSGVADCDIHLIDEEYQYKDKASEGETPPWPCNEYYDLKAFRWWMRSKEYRGGETLLWNIG